MTWLELLDPAISTVRTTLMVWEPVKFFLFFWEREKKKYLFFFLSSLLSFLFFPFFLCNWALFPLSKTHYLFLIKKKLALLVIWFSMTIFSLVFFPHDQASWVFCIHCLYFLCTLMSLHFSLTSSPVKEITFSQIASDLDLTCNEHI